MKKLKIQITMDINYICNLGFVHICMYEYTLIHLYMYLWNFLFFKRIKTKNVSNCEILRKKVKKRVDACRRAWINCWVFRTLSWYSGDFGQTGCYTPIDDGTLITGSRVNMSKRHGVSTRVEINGKHFLESAMRPM